MLLTDNIVYFQIAGIFGWSGTPAAFQVITRAISWELRHHVSSATVMYVDDIVGVGLVGEIEADLAITRNVCVSLLGPTAVAATTKVTSAKSEIISQIPIIGNKAATKACVGFVGGQLNASSINGIPYSLHGSKIFRPWRQCPLSLDAESSRIDCSLPL